MTQSLEHPIRLGIIGLGLIAQSQHFPNLLSNLRDRLAINHICDLSAGLAAAFGEELGTRFSTDANTLLDDPEVDAVLICTPGAHSAIARRALEAGKHVFAEKPYSYDPEIAIRDAGYAAGRRLVLQVGYMKMYEPALEAARAKFETIGPLRLVRMTVLHPSDEFQTGNLDTKRFSDVDAAELEKAGKNEEAEVHGAIANWPRIDPVLFRNVLHGSVCHQVSVLRALFPESSLNLVSAHQNAPGTERAEPPKMQVLGKVQDGPDWMISWNWLTHFPDYQEWVEIYGDRGSLRLDFPPPYRKSELARLMTTFCAADNSVVTESLAPNGPSAFHLELAAFADAIAHGTGVLSDATGAGLDSRLLRDIAVLLG